MSRQIRLLFGISVFWLALSVLFDGVNTLVLPLQLSRLGGQNNQATILGLLTFAGLMGAALVQPVAGAFSDRLRPRMGRKGFIAVGLLLSLISLFLFATVENLVGVMAGYLSIQVSASIAQAGQQGLLPDLIPEKRRGLASGLKGFMDLTGAMLGFVLLGQLLGMGNIFRAMGVIAAILVVAFILAALFTPEDRPDMESPIFKTSTPMIWQFFRFDLGEQPAFTRLLMSRFLFLLGIYGTGRFLLLFVADRLGLSEGQAAQQAGNLLAGLALITVLASPLAGWLADRIGRVPIMIAGAVMSGMSALLLVGAGSASQILLFGGLMSVGSAAFAGGSWAWLADLVPKQESARFFGLANFSTAGSAAAAGLFGPVIDSVERISPGMGFSVLFILAASAFFTSVLPLRRSLLEKNGGRDEDKDKIRAHDSGLAVVPLPADPALVEKDDQDSPGGTARL